jgi:hypothetical protein
MEKSAGRECGFAPNIGQIIASKSRSDYKRHPDAKASGIRGMAADLPTSAS